MKSLGVVFFEIFLGMATSAYAAAFQLCPDTQYTIFSVFKVGRSPLLCSRLRCCHYVLY